MKPNKVPAIAYLVIEVVGAVYNLRRRQILKPGTKRFVSIPRQIIMFLLNKKLRLSTPVIGHLLWGRDHGTVMSGVRNIERMMAEDPEFRARVDAFAVVLKLRGWQELLAPLPPAPTLAVSS